MLMLSPGNYECNNCGERNIFPGEIPEPTPKKEPARSKKEPVARAKKAAPKPKKAKKAK